LDFALICDYVRAQDGVAHVIGAGFDTIHMEEVPSGHNIGLLARILLARNECGRLHRVEVLIQDEDGARVSLHSSRTGRLIGPLTESL
jgi:hypothetical protein